MTSHGMSRAPRRRFELLWTVRRTLQEEELKKMLNTSHCTRRGEGRARVRRRRRRRRPPLRGGRCQRGWEGQANPQPVCRSVRELEFDVRSINEFSASKIIYIIWPRIDTHVTVLLFRKAIGEPILRGKLWFIFISCLATGENNHRLVEDWSWCCFKWWCNCN